MSGHRLGAWASLSVLGLVIFAASTRPWPGAPASVASAASADAARPTLRAADFGSLTPTDDARWLADRIVATDDNDRTAFLLVDKRAAQLHVFDADGVRIASTPVLLGAAVGDESVPGIGTRPMAAIAEHERTTPAGRFVGERGRNAAGEDVVWVDYDAAVSLHRVRLTNRAERRAERLASPSVADNRISYGCINVPAAFYDRHVQAIFAQRHAVIYVLPDVRSAREVFAARLDAAPSRRELSALAAVR